MKDLEQRWKSMLCVEVANVGDAAIRWRAGEQHTMRTGAGEG